MSVERTDTPADQETWMEAFEASETFNELNDECREQWEAIDLDLLGRLFVWAYELGYQEALANQEQAKVYSVEMQPIERCGKSHPKEGWQCTRRAGHRGEHTALAPSAWHPDYAVKMDGTPNTEPS